jgi:hypothetical protein
MSGRPRRQERPGRSARAHPAGKHVESPFPGKEEGRQTEAECAPSEGAAGPPRDTRAGSRPEIPELCVQRAAERPHNAQKGGKGRGTFGLRKMALAGLPAARAQGRRAAAAAKQMECALTLRGRAGAGEARGWGDSQREGRVLPRPSIKENPSHPPHPSQVPVPRDDCTPQTPPDKLPGFLPHDDRGGGAAPQTAPASRSMLTMSLWPNSLARSRGVKPPSQQ